MLELLRDKKLFCNLTDSLMRSLVVESRFSGIEFHNVTLSMVRAEW